MSDCILVGTRKGTFFVQKTAGRWTPRLVGHGGAGVNFVARDPHTGTLWAALGHGHWGAKLSRSSDDGATWADANQIKYPEGARYLATPEPSEGDEDAFPGKATLKEATVLKLWTIAFGQPGSIYVGTIPGGLFESHDGGESFELNLPLWNHESRGGNLFERNTSGETHWYGTPASEGGDFAPGIHSILVDPRDHARVLVAVCCEMQGLESAERKFGWPRRSMDWCIIWRNRSLLLPTVKIGSGIQSPILRNLTRCS